MNESTGMIFDVQHFSLQDGPGVRTTIFFKGCPLRCKWCSNPESQEMRPQILYYAHLCIHCKKCLEACPQNAIEIHSNTLVRNKNCISCGLCVNVCTQHAIVLSGRIASVEELCYEVDKDWRIMTQSGGGVTISGGEPLAQPKFLKNLLKDIHEKYGFNTCIETTLFTAWENIENILPFLDMAYVDIKHMDSETHNMATNQPNYIILKNISKLAITKLPITIRLPLIPEYNDTYENINKLGQFLNEHKLFNLEIMPQHTLGKSKYTALSRVYQINERVTPNIKLAVDVLSQYNINVSVHGDN